MKAAMERIEAAKAAWKDDEWMTARLKGAERELRTATWMVGLIDQLQAGELSPEKFAQRWSEELGLWKLPAHRKGEPCPNCRLPFGCVNRCKGEE